MTPIFHHRLKIDVLPFNILKLLVLTQKRVYSGKLLNWSWIAHLSFTKIFAQNSIEIVGKLKNYKPFKHLVKALPARIWMFHKFALFL